MEQIGWTMLCKGSRVVFRPGTVKGDTCHKPKLVESMVCINV